jgi:hypothetical protein
VETAFDRKPPHTVHSDREAAFSLDGKDAFRFRWRIFDASLRELLRSPQYRLALSAQTMDVALPKGARLLCNGRPAAGRAILATGVNELEVQAPAGAQVRLSVDGAPISFPEGWRKAGADRWKLTLADGATELWPNWKADALHLIRGGVQHLFFCPRGFPGSTASEYTLVLDLPEGVQFLGASGYINHHQTTVRESPSPLGRGWTRRRIAFSQPRKWSETLPTDRYYTVVLAADADVSAESSAFYFHAESPADGLSEAPQKVPLVFLPAIRGTQPKTLGVGISSFRLGALDDLALTRRTLAFFRDLGATRFTSANKHHYAELPNAIYFNFRWCFSFVPFLKEHPDYALIDRRGRRSDHLVCSRKFLTAPECRKYIVESLPAWHKRWGMVEHLCWDYEFRVLDAPIACFCDECRADFAKAARLPGVPNAAEIAARHFDAWTDYMTTRFADLAELLCKAAHEALPGIVFSVYSGYQSDENCSFFGVDWRKLDGRIDLAIAGYGRALAVLTATRKALPRTPLALGAYTRPYEFGDKRPVPPVTLAQLLRRSADATAGFFVYYLPNLDGRSYTAISRAASILARYEPFFLRGENHPERLAAAGLPEADAALLSDGQGKWLLVLMNHGRRPQRFRLDAAKLGLSGLPPEVTLAPGDGAVFPAK